VLCDVRGTVVQCDVTYGDCCAVWCDVWETVVQCHVM